MKIFERIEGRIIFGFICLKIFSVCNKPLMEQLRLGRKIVVFGRSMEKAIVNGLELGYIKAPKGTFIEPK